MGKTGKGDIQGAKKIFKKLPKQVIRAYGDGVYDTSECYKDLKRQKIKLIISPQKNRVNHELRKKPSMKNRNEALEAIKGLGGKRGRKENLEEINRIS